MLEDLTGQIEGLVFPKVYERYVPLLNVDSLVILDGKLSFREEEEPKLLVDAVRPLDGRNAAQRIAEPLKMASARTESRDAPGAPAPDAPALTETGAPDESSMCLCPAARKWRASRPNAPRTPAMCPCM